MRGTKPLFENTDLTLNPGDKIGLIGANGAGKSTLFGMLRDELHPDQGSIDFPRSWRVAYVAQETPALERPAVEYAIDGDTTLRRLEKELAELRPRENAVCDCPSVQDPEALLCDNEGDREKALQPPPNEGDGGEAVSCAEPIRSALVEEKED
jgi:ATP-binding cassette subfamily F protein 3